jgi:hypothetical protein
MHDFDALCIGLIAEKCDAGDLAAGLSSSFLVAPTQELWRLSTTR